MGECSNLCDTPAPLKAFLQQSHFGLPPNGHAKLLPSVINKVAKQQQHDSPTFRPHIILFSLMNTGKMADELTKVTEPVVAANKRAHLSRTSWAASGREVSSENFPRA